MYKHLDRKISNIGTLDGAKPDSNFQEKKIIIGHVEFCTLGQAYIKMKENKDLRCNS